ncbi:MAG TPA: caspase family protein, partial [Coleofasciculaceae cyanobacterium]
NLSGCVGDVEKVEAYLKDFRKVPPTQILKLTATPDPQDETKPIEPLEKLPTRENIVNAFRDLGKMASPKSQVYIHFSGHGGRAKTIYADIKQGIDIDEGLVPTDIGTSEGQYIRDLELAHLLNELVRQELDVTLILDCCHSGGATRGEAEVRGMPVVDDKPAQASFNPVAELDDLKKTWESLNAGGTRGLKAGGLTGKDYVLLAACRQDEVAFEFPFNRETKEKNGALTYWLLDTLKQPFPGQTYQDLFDRIYGKIHSQFSTQTPILLGEGNRKIFGSELGDIVKTVAVLAAEVDEKTQELRALLQVGQINGVSKGAEFAIYPSGTTDFKRENRIAIARLLQRGSTQSLCKLEPIEGKALQVEAGDKAVQTSVPVNLVRKVAFDRQKEATSEELAQPQLAAQSWHPEIFAAQDTALDAVKAALNGNGWVEPDDTYGDAGDDAGVSFIVGINNHGEYEICDSGGVPFQNINPPLKISDPAAPETLVKRLVHLAKYKTTEELDNTDTESPLSGKLIVEWWGTSENYEKGDPIPKKNQLTALDDLTKPIVKEGDYIFLCIKNVSPQALNIAALNLAADWSIEQIFPVRAAEKTFLLEAGQEKILPLRVAMDGKGDRAENFVKVFASLDEANFRFLELPSLDQPLSPKGATRSGLSPLERLLAAVNDEVPKTRKLSVASSPSTEWTTKQVLLTIRR